MVVVVGKYVIPRAVVIAIVVVITIGKYVIATTAIAVVIIVVIRLVDRVVVVRQVVAHHSTPCDWHLIVLII